MARRYFNPDDAESMLPAITPLMRRAQRLKRRLDNYGRVESRVMTDGSEERSVDVCLFDAEYYGLRETFYETVEKMEKEGCLVRNIDEGAIDFYAQFEGRDIFLSWALGDDAVSHWHELEEDAFNRKPILDLR